MAIVILESIAKSYMKYKALKRIFKDRKGLIFVNNGETFYRGGGTKRLQ